MRVVHRQHSNGNEAYARFGIGAGIFIPWEQEGRSLASLGPYGLRTRNHLRCFERPVSRFGARDCHAGSFLERRWRVELEVTLVALFRRRVVLSDFVAADLDGTVATD